MLEPALPVLVALALGLYCRRSSFLSRDHVDALKKVVVNITLPAVLFSAFATAEYSLQTISIPVLVFALKDPNNIIRALKGEKIGTIVKED